MMQKKASDNFRRKIKLKNNSLAHNPDQLLRHGGRKCGRAGSDINYFRRLPTENRTL